MSILPNATTPAARPSPSPATPLSEPRRPLRFSHRCMWATVFKWAGFNRNLRRQQADFLQRLPADYRRRVVRSAIRTTTFISMLATVLNRPFDQTNGLLAGLLAALFDDLFDENWEDAETILDLIDHPDRTESSSDRSRDFRELYLQLRARLEPWQQTQLEQVLHGLARSEIRLLAGDAYPEHWRDRGTAAFAVYLTILGVPEATWHTEPLGLFGEYLQILDDYEDFAQDAPAVNWFHVHADFDLDGHFFDAVVPALRRMFARPDYDAALMAEFMESFHLFVIEHNQGRVPSRVPPSPVDYPWWPAHGPLRPAGLLWLVWIGTSVATTATYRLLPASLRLPWTHVMLAMFGWT